MEVDVRIGTKQEAKSLRSDGMDIASAKGTGIDPKSGGEWPDDTIYMIAESKDGPVGFFAFCKLGTERAVHCYLRTFGETTRKTFRKALNLAFTALGMDRVYGYYPVTRRSCKKICDDVGFVFDHEAPRLYAIHNSNEIFVWRRIDKQPL